MQLTPHARALHHALSELGLYQDEYLVMIDGGRLRFSLLHLPGRVPDATIVTAVKLSWKDGR